MKITVPVGTRPEIVKLARTIASLRAAGHQVRCVATGQHFDAKLAGDVFDELGCPPDVVWQLPAGEGDRVGSLLAQAFSELAEHRPDAVLVLGDTYSAPLVAIAARRFGVGVVHLEAGLRSFNEQSVEEVNRRMMVALATVHLAPTELAAQFLRDEGVEPERIQVVGNPVVDALAESGVQRSDDEERRGVLLTAHRATNVDDEARLAELVTLVRLLGERHGPVTFPMHPRTRAKLTAAGRLNEVATLPGVRVVDPMPYGELLATLARSQVVVTDSGGLQEEASWLGIPAVVLRNTTPRWEGVVGGAAVLCGLDAELVLRHVARFGDPVEQARVAALPCPYGDGHTAARVVRCFDDEQLMALLSPSEPVVGGALPTRVGVRLLDAASA
ncbi:MAG: non-hydrolyzing UDP-N-acetylglucosamine 2-epimerase [Acidothermaceae bacterium]